MSKSVSRNDPCPCGSGKKYKHCCLDKPPQKAAARIGLPLFLAVVAIAFGGLVGYSKGAVPGIIVGAGGLIIVGLVIALRDPPPSSGGGDPGAINFGA